MEIEKMLKIASKNAIKIALEIALKIAKYLKYGTHQSEFILREKHCHRRYFVNDVK